MDSKLLRCYDKIYIYVYKRERTYEKTKEQMEDCGRDHTDLPVDRINYYWWHSCLAEHVTNEIYAVSCFNSCVAFDNCLLFFLFEG